MPFYAPSEYPCGNDPLWCAHKQPDPNTHGDNTICFKLIRYTPTGFRAASNLRFGDYWTHASEICEADHFRATVASVHDINEWKTVENMVGLCLPRLGTYIVFNIDIYHILIIIQHLILGVNGMGNLWENRNYAHF